MNIEDLRNYCLAKPQVTEHTPFDEVTLVYKLMGKMFALLPTDHELCITLKCEPELSVALREQYHAISGAWHMNKTHWNTIIIDGSVPDKLVYELIDCSYELVVASLPRKLREVM